MNKPEENDGDAGDALRGCLIGLAGCLVVIAGVAVAVALVGAFWIGLVVMLQRFVN